MQWVLSGCERADTLIINPYKWLFLPLDGSVFYTRWPETLKATFSLVPDYLSNTQSEGQEGTNFMDYGIALSRRFRALKLWMVLRYFGQEGLAARLREHMRLAHLLADWIDESADFERLAPTPFSVVCFRAHPHHMDDESVLDTLNEQILHHINTAGRFFLSHTRVDGRFALRIAIGNLRTTEAHVAEVWQQLQQACTDLLAGGALAGRQQ